MNPTKTLALVTCFYDLPKRGSAEHRTIDWMLANADFVLMQDRELVIFTDPELETVLRARRGSRRTKIVPIPFEKLLRSDRVTAAERGMLQHNARKTKVTPAYVQLMWAKYAMLEMALELTSASHLGWIDLSIAHVAKLPPADVDVFADPSDVPRVHVLRCFSKRDVDADDYWHNVRGHLAGGLVVGARSFMRELVGSFWTAVDRATAMKLAPLDEGLLDYVVGQRPGDFSYSYGDYEDIVCNHDASRGGDAHRAWIIADAQARGLPATMEEAALLQSPRPAVQDRPLLGLVMIIRNEAHGIVETLRSFAPYIDYWTIMDTGSTDNTMELVHAALRNVPGDLVIEEFVDFSTTRNRALAVHGEKTHWTIMPDADDLLVGGEELRQQLASADAGQDGFMVNLRRGHLDYYLPLVLRSSKKHRYIGRVHEYVDRMFDQKLRGVAVHQDAPPLSREASKKRWERDLRLLEDDLKVNSRNPRALFYLAQTHECLGQKDEAITHYLERIAVGGWIDETFEAHLRLAGVYRSKSMDVEADHWLLKAHTFMPDRAEPLLKLAQHYRSKDNHALAFLFANRGAAMPRSKSTLFVDHHAPMECSYIASIHAYYLKDQEARQAGADHAKDSVREDPSNSSRRSNWAFYAPDVKRAFGALTRQIDFTAPIGWNASNPSVHYDAVEDRLRCVVRTTNYKIVNGHYLTPDDNVIYTRNWALELSKDLSTTRAVEMIDCTNIPRSRYPVHGFEDCRLYRVADRLMCSATVCDFDLDKADEGPREIVAMQLSDAYEITQARPIRGVWSTNSQKNWMPFEKHDREEWIYATLNNTGNTTWIAPDRPPPTLDHGRLRGGSQLVRLSDRTWIAVVHDVAFPGGSARLYLHRFVRFNEDASRVLAMTDPFYFQKLGIEFCCGLAKLDDRLIASFSVDDASANFAVFDLEAVLAAMDDDFIV